MIEGKLRRYLTPDVILELLPSLVFLIANLVGDFRIATICALIATVISVGTGYLLRKQVPKIAIASCIIVLLLNGASLYFDDETFVKVRPTIGSCLFASALLWGLFIKPMFLERALGSALSLTQQGWQVLHFCWIAFAIFRAILNELIWRLADSDTWVLYKTAEDFATVAGYILITHAVAKVYWDVEALSK